MDYDRAGYGLTLGIIAIVAGFLIIYPSLFVAWGLQAAGAAAGWWAGDPNMNDGEEVWATGIGAIACAVILGGALIAALLFRRTFRVRSVVPAFVLIAALAVAATVLWTVQLI